MKIIFIVCMVIINHWLNAQGSVRPSNFPALTPIRGLSLSKSDLGTGLKYNDGSFLSEKSADIKGSPFFIDDWKYGNVLLKTKERIDSVSLKYNLYADLLLVKVDGQEYQFNIDVSEFLLPDPSTNQMILFRSGFIPVPGMNEKSFYQVLYDGKTKLLLKHKKSIVSELTSTPGVKIKAYEDQRNYFILTPSGKMEKIKKKNKGILDLLDGEKEELKKLVDSKKMKLDNEDEIISVLYYYDSLEQK